MVFPGDMFTHTVASDQDLYLEYQILSLLFFTRIKKMTKMGGCYFGQVSVTTVQCPLILFIC